MAEKGQPSVRKAWGINNLSRKQKSKAIKKSSFLITVGLKHAKTALALKWLIHFRMVPCGLPRANLINAVQFCCCLSNGHSRVMAYDPSRRPFPLVYIHSIWPRKDWLTKLIWLSWIKDYFKFGRHIWEWLTTDIFVIIYIIHYFRHKNKGDRKKN